MDDETSGTAPAEELLAALKQARKASNVTGVELARRSGYSQSTISRMERGDLAVSMLAAARWAWYLRRPRAELRALVSLARAVAEDRAGLVPMRVMLQDGGAQSIQRRIRLRERNVTEQSVFHPSLLPGHLQTEAYMQVVLQGGPPEELPILIKDRLRRQNEAANRKITFLITEGTLKQGMPDAEMMAAQCEHLAELAVTHRFWRLGVIPAVSAESNLTMNGFDLYDDQQVFIGTTAGNALVKEGRAVAEHVQRFAQLARIAVYGDEAAAILLRIAEEFRP